MRFVRSTSVYLNNGTIYIVPQVKTFMGLCSATVPVSVHELPTNYESIGSAVIRALMAYKEQCPAPLGSAIEKYVLRPLGYKSWKAFARSTVLVSVEEEEGVVRFVRSKLNPRSGVFFFLDPEPLRASLGDAHVLGELLMRALQPDVKSSEHDSLK
ncbi:MAG: hypothetical protein ACKVP0_13940 [Pirellulaceae bacterium]